MALVLPSALLAALLGLDQYVLEAMLPRPVALALTLVIGVAGVVSFSLLIFGRLTALHERLARQDARLVASEERQRIAKELQDGVVQSLFGVSLLIDDAAERLQTEPAEARGELGRAVGRITATIERLRATLES